MLTLTNPTKSSFPCRISGPMGIKIEKIQEAENEQDEEKPKWEY